MVIVFKTINVLKKVTIEGAGFMRKSNSELNGYFKLYSMYYNFLLINHYDAEMDSF